LFLKKQDLPMHEISTPIIKAYLDTRHSNNNYNVHRRELSGDGSPKEIRVKINAELYEILWKRWENRTQDQWVFYNEQTQSRFLKRPKFMPGLCKRAGIDPPFGFHALRHLMSSLLDGDPKVSTKTIQKILGHASQRTTEIYLHELDTAMDSLSGRFTKTI
jgi:integrase